MAKLRALVTTALALVVLASASGCAEGADDVAVEDASRDLSCDHIEVLDTETEGDGLERFRLFGCGHDVVYSCELHVTRTRRDWTCARSDDRFPV